MTTLDETRTGTYRELLGPKHLGTSVVLAGGVALYALNIFLTSSLLPTAVGDIGGERLYAWNTTIFMIASVISSIMVSRTLTARGPAGSYLLALAPFLAGTLLAAASPTMEVLLLARAIQGAGGGMLAGLGYAVIRAALPEHLWAKATALISAMWGIGTLVGPAIGGLFAQFGAWRLAFVSLAVLGVVVALIVPRALPRSGGSGEKEPVPVVSLVFLSLTTVLISVAGVFEDHLVLVLSLAALALVAFVWWERRSPVRILPRSTYSAGPLKWIYLSIAILTTGTATEAFTPLFGQRLAGAEPLVAAFLGAAVSLGWSVSMVFSANAITPRVVRRLKTYGPALLALGLGVTGVFQVDGAGGVLVAVWFAALVLAGVGIGIAFPHFVVGALSSSDDPDEAGKAAAGANTVELISLAFASAVGGVLVNLGAPVMERSAQYLLLGFAVIALLGVVTGRRA